MQHRMIALAANKVEPAIGLVTLTEAELDAVAAGVVVFDLGVNVMGAAPSVTGKLSIDETPTSSAATLVLTVMSGGPIPPSV